MVSHNRLGAFLMAILRVWCAAGVEDDEMAGSDADDNAGVRLMEEALDILEQAQAMLSEAEDKVRCTT
jgi:hypothetical protein